MKKALSLFGIISLCLLLSPVCGLYAEGEDTSGANWKEEIVTITHPVQLAARVLTGRIVLDLRADLEPGLIVQTVS